VKGLLCKAQPIIYTSTPLNTFSYAAIMRLSLNLPAVVILSFVLLSCKLHLYLSAKINFILIYNLDFVVIYAPLYVEVFRLHL
jgi:hypothetical protein